jgi:hypothetical protein
MFILSIDISTIASKVFRPGNIVDEDGKRNLYLKYTYPKKNNYSRKYLYCFYYIRYFIKIVKDIMNRNDLFSNTDSYMIIKSSPYLKLLLSKFYDNIHIINKNVIQISSKFFLIKEGFKINGINFRSRYTPEEIKYLINKIINSNIILHIYRNDGTIVEMNILDLYKNNKDINSINCEEKIFISGFLAFYNLLLLTYFFLCTNFNNRQEEKISSYSIIKV